MDVKKCCTSVALNMKVRKKRLLGTKVEIRDREEHYAKERTTEKANHR
jgi:hypothetical protein